MTRADADSWDVASSVGATATMVASARAGGRRRVAVASWLLAPGVFQRRLDDVCAGVGAVAAAPLGLHPGVLDAVLTTYFDAAGDRSAAA